MPAKNGPRQIVQRAVKKPAVYRSIRTVVLARPVSIEQPHDNALGAVLQRRIADLHFVDPLRHRVVVELLDLILVHHRFDHQIGPVAIDFRRREMNQAKPQAFLQADDVLRADRVRLPQRFVKVFAIPTAKLCRAVIDIIERSTALEHTLQLSKLADVATRVERHFHIGAQAKTDLIRLVLQVARDYMMSPPAQLLDEPRSDRPESARYKNAHVCDPVVLASTPKALANSSPRLPQPWVYCGQPYEL